MNKKILLILFIIFSVNHCIAQWFTQSSSVSQTLNRVIFTSSDTGYVAGGGFLISGESGVILKTTNAGVNWLSLNYGSFQKVYNIYFFNSLKGFASCNGNLLLKTSNGGINWTSVSLPVIFSAIGAVYFTSLDTGFICGYYSKDFMLLKTYDGGNNWVQKFGESGITYYHNSFYFINSNTGFATRTGSYFKTTNAGENWSTLAVLGSSSKELFFFNEMSGIGVNGDQTGGAIYKTSNQGANWQRTDFGTPVKAVHFFNNNLGLVACDSGIIKYTNNGGSNWSRTPSGTNVKSSLNSMYFVNQLTGYIVGDSGVILKTTSGGLTFINNNPAEIPNNFYLHQNYPNPLTLLQK